jgi:hypothetical protein
MFLQLIRLLMNSVPYQVHIDTIADLRGAVVKFDLNHLKFSLNRVTAVAS